VGTVQRTKRSREPYTCMGRADRTVVPLPRHSLAAARAAPGVVKSLPTTVSTGGYTLGVLSEGGQSRAQNQGEQSLGESLREQ